MATFFFTIVILLGLSMALRGFAFVCCAGISALTLYVLKKDKARASQAFSMLGNIIVS
jgi:hypothetical protein